MKVKATKMGSIRAVRKSLKKGSGQFIKGIPEDGIVVRFLEEPDQWVGYDEHYDGEMKAFYPCIEGDCPGCDQNLRASFRYLTNAVNVDDDRAIPLKLPKSLANRLMVKYDKYNTITDRDYELTRMGTGLDTDYDLEPLDRKTRNLNKYEKRDLSALLEQVFNQTFKTDDDDDEEDVPRRGRRARPKPNPRRAIGARKASGSVKKGGTKKLPGKRPAKAVGKRRVVRR